MCTPVVYSKRLLCDIDLVNLKCNQLKKKKKKSVTQKFPLPKPPPALCFFFLEIFPMGGVFLGGGLQTDVIT